MSKFTLTGKMNINDSNNTTFVVEYNPSVTGFKRVFSESFVTTLGSQYPFYRRNGNVNYRQFNIGGLISAASGLNEDNGWENITFGSKGTGYSSLENEYNFRSQVMEFLTNGLPKTYSSDTEGTIQIMLSNISFTPEKQLGRLIYSFTAQATEIGNPSSTEGTGGNE